MTRALPSPTRYGPWAPTTSSTARMLNGRVIGKLALALPAP
ncbi:hypothetical protein [Streptomyces pseudoechinosporeus]